MSQISFLFSGHLSCALAISSSAISIARKRRSRALENRGSISPLTMSISYHPVDSVLLRITLLKSLIPCSSTIFWQYSS